MQIKNVKTPQWANAEHTLLDVTLETDTYGEIPFSASPDDVEAYGREIFEDAVAGKFGIIAEYVAPPLPPRVVPQSVTRYQGRAALLQIGLLDDIDAYYAALPIDTEDTEVNMYNRIAKERWAGILNFERSSAELSSVASLYNLSETQVDDLFCFAATIV